MKELTQIIEYFPNELNQVKSKLKSIIEFEDGPSECLVQLQELFSNNFPESFKIPISAFTKSLCFLSNQETNIIYFQLFTILSKGLNSFELSRIVKENEIFENVIKDFFAVISEKGLNLSSNSLFFRVDYYTFLKSYLEFLEFLNFRTDIEVDYYSEKKLIVQIYSNSDDFILQSLFFKSYNQGLKFMRICNSYYRSMMICSEAIRENSKILSLNFFKFFKFLILKSNKKTSISIRNKKFHCVISKQIVGYEDLVYLFYNSEKTLYKKCRNLISSFLTCFSPKSSSEIKIILKSLIFILISACNKSKKLHQVRLIKLVYSISNEKNFKKSKKFTEVLVNFGNNLETIKTYKFIQVKYARQLMGKQFKLDPESISFDIDKKTYGPQQNNKMIKLTQDLCLNVKIEKSIFEINNVLFFKNLEEYNEFFWELAVETQGEKFNDNCIFISKFTFSKELRDSILNFNIDIESLNRKSIAFQMLIVNVMSFVSANQDWVWCAKSLNLHNKFVEFIAVFLERKVNFKLFWEVIDLIANFGKIQNFNKITIFRLARALGYWILDHPKEELRAFSIKTLAKALIFLSGQLSSNHKSSLINELIIQNIENIANYVLAAPMKTINFIYSLHLKNFDVPKSTINLMLHKINEKIESLKEIDPINLIHKTSYLSHYNFSTQSILFTIFKHLFNYSEDSDNPNIEFIIMTLIKHSDFKLPLSEFENFINTFMIPIPNNPNQDFPLFKTHESRSLGYEFVDSQCKSDQNKVLSLQKILDPLLLNKTWRQVHTKYWSIKLNPIEDSTTYRGINNPGSICYSNCFIQQLYYIPTFREPLLRLLTNENNTLTALQKVFVKLKFSNKSSISSKALIKVCLGSKGLTEQMDTDEFFLTLLEKCSNSEVGSKFEEIVQENFGGIQNLQVKCNECGKIYHKKQNFKGIGLEILKNCKNSLMNSLKAFTKGEMLSGENSPFCEGCGRKNDSRVKISFFRLPENLIFIIKRFEYDGGKMVKVKINERFEFSEEINLTQFTDRESGYNLSNCNYQLKGVINHIGTSDHGHYISCVKIDNTEWVEFNDSRVSKITRKKLFKTSFGSFQGLSNTSSAYILIYQKTESLLKFTKSFNLSNTELKLLPELTEKNRLKKSTELLFSTDFLDYFTSLLNYKELYTTNIHFFLSCFIRMDITESKIMDYYRKMYKMFNTKSIIYLIEILISSGGIDEFILCNPHPEHKTFIITLIEKHITSIEKDFILLTFKRLLKLFEKFGISVHNCDVYLNQLFFIFANNLEKEMKNEYIESVHFKFFNNKLMESEINVEEFHCNFNWNNEFKDTNQNVELDQRCPYLFFNFLTENYSNLSDNQVKSLKGDAFIKKALSFTKTKLCNIAITLLFSKIYENDIPGALKYLTTILEQCRNYYAYYKLMLIPLFFNAFSDRAELFIHFIGPYLNILNSDHKTSLEEYTNNLIKSLRKFKFSDIESKLNFELKERLNNIIEVLLCEGKKNRIITIAGNFLTGDYTEVFDKNDEIKSKYIEVGEIIWFFEEDWVEYLVKDNFEGKILQLEGKSSVILLDYVHFSKIEFAGQD